MSLLTTLLRNGEKYEWTSNGQRVFEHVKSILCSDFATLQFENYFSLQGDASYMRAGAVPIQADDQGVFHPI